MKVAIVHYWFVGMRGGEKVVDELLDLFPKADIYTHVINNSYIPDKITDRVVETTFIQKLPKSDKLYQSYLPLMPYALEQLDLSSYDLIISSESGPAKGIITSPDSLHICYCHSPMRYIWDMYHSYKKSAGFIQKLFMPILTHHLRLWDLASAYRVDKFIANSSFVNKRISKIYRRESKIIFPPVNTSAFYISDVLDDYYLFVGQLVPYKNAELAVDAFNINGKPLIIVGEGKQYKCLRAKANSNITMVGHQSFDNIRKYYAKCKALIFPGIEDFGMVPVEAMASGRPVIALKKGGALDTVVDGETGLFFNNPTVESLNEVLEKFEKNIAQFDAQKISSYAEKFDSSVFKDEIKTFIDSCFSDLN